MASAVEFLYQGTLAGLLEPGEVAQRESYAYGSVQPPGGVAAGDLVMTDRRLLWFQRRTRSEWLRGPMVGIFVVRFADIESVELWQSRWLRAQNVGVRVAGGLFVFHISEWGLWTIPRAVLGRSTYPRPSETVERMEILKQHVEARS